MQATFRPVQWTAPTTPAAARRSRYTFKAPWNATLDQLDRELRHLDATNLVIQADFAEQDLRLDGMPRANARQPVFPGVRILFDSKHGPLAYETDAYEFWQHNVRAIALALEALRAVDRYGVTHHAEQYKGWKAIGSGGAATPMPQSAMTKTDARDFVITHAGVGDVGAAVDAWEVSLGARTRLYRQAAMRLHPDQGGSADLFQQLQSAKEVLGL